MNKDRPVHCADCPLGEEAGIFGVDEIHLCAVRITLQNALDCFTMFLSI